MKNTSENQEVDMAHISDYICNVKDKYVVNKCNGDSCPINIPTENPYIAEIRKELEDDKSGNS